MSVPRKFLSACLLVGSLLTAAPVFAQGITGMIKMGLDASAPQEYRSSNTNLPNIVAGLIRVALSLVGVLLLIYLVYAGFLWMTAQGEGKQVDKAKDIIKNTVIGLVIIFAAYAIADQVLIWLQTASSAPTATGGTGEGGVKPL